MTTPLQSDQGTATKLLLSVAEAAHALAISERTVWRLLASGDLQQVRCGRCSRVLAASIEAFIAKGGSR